MKYTFAEVMAWRVRTARESQGLLIHEAAARAKVRESLWQDVEAGLDGPFSRVMRILDSLNIECKDIWNECEG